MIRVEDLHKHFGGFHAVDGATLEIAPGSITGLIGPNGAGKTTLFNVIAGNLPPTSGRVYMDGEDITGLPPHELFHKRLLRTFQIAHEFSSMTVRENLMMVPGDQRGEAIWNAWFKRSQIAKDEAALLQKADEVLESFEKAVALIPDVLECHLMAGTADYLLKVVAENTEDFARIHRQYLARLPGVAQMQSSFALRTVFKTTALPV